MGTYKFLYGPVPSRRLGLSLGVDIIPSKYCSYSCIYCQLKRTDHLTVERRSFFPIQSVLEEISNRISETDIKPDRITFSGSGEPTLNADIGKIICGIKAMTDIPVTVITNGSLLWMPEVRDDIKNADLVVPSMDSVIDESFKKVNRPHPSLTAEKIMKGIIKFREEFKGRLWLEILLVRGINDSDEDISSLTSFTTRLKPDRIQLNTVVRPPAEEFAQPVSKEELERISVLFTPRAEVIADFSSTTPHKHNEPLKKNLITDMLNRRPCRLKDIADSLSFDETDIINVLSEMENEGLVESKNEKTGIYFYLKR